MWERHKKGSRVYNSWYDTLEPKIRLIVKMIRNKGFNTTCSCEHDLTIELECYHEGDVANLYNLLMDTNSHKFSKKFRITMVWETYPLHRKYIELKFLKEI